MANSISHGIVVMAETALPVDAEDYLEEEDIGLSDKEKKAVKSFVADERRVHGQTPDELRSAALKIVSKVLQRKIKEAGITESYWRDFRVFVNEPRHLIRSMHPSGVEALFARRLGRLSL